MYIETKRIIRNGMPFRVKVKEDELAKVEDIEPENLQKSTEINKKRGKDGKNKTKN